MNISIIGNGFDIRHNYKTGFIDFLNAYKEYCNETDGKKNIIASYFDKVNTSNGWLDFEEELKEFLIYTERLDNALEFNGSINQRIINIDKFVDSNNSYLYYEILKEMNYSFFDSYGFQNEYTSIAQYFPIV